MYYAEHSGGKKEQKTYAAAMSSISYLETWKKKIQDDQKKLFSVESNTNPENHKLPFQSNDKYLWWTLFGLP